MSFVERERRRRRLEKNRELWEQVGETILDLYERLDRVEEKLEEREAERLNKIEEVAANVEKIKKPSSLP